MNKKQKLDHLNRLVKLISDDNELLNRANDFMQTLVNNTVNVHGKSDISSELKKQERGNSSEKRPQ